MSKVLVNDTNLSAIAEAIREKNGEETTYKPREMAEAIRNIQSGVEPILMPTTWEENEGTYNWEGTYYRLTEKSIFSVIMPQDLSDDMIFRIQFANYSSSNRGTVVRKVYHDENEVASQSFTTDDTYDLKDTALAGDRVEVTITPYSAGSYMQNFFCGFYHADGSPVSFLFSDLPVSECLSNIKISIYHREVVPPTKELIEQGYLQLGEEVKYLDAEGGKF